MFYDNFVKLCNSVDKSPSAVALEIGIYKSTVSNWKNRGTFPTDATLQKIADYFGVSVAELTEEQKESPTPKGAGQFPMEFFDLNEANQEFIRASIAHLLASQSADE